MSGAINGIRGSLDVAASKFRGSINAVRNAIQPENRLFTLIQNSGATDELQHLINKIKNVNCQRKNKDTFLHIAAGSGNLVAAKLLIGRGARIDLTNDEGKTPYQVAVKQKKTRFSEYLETVHINILLDRSMDEVKKLELLRGYLQQGFDKHAVDKAGKTLLHIATEKGYKKIVEFLVEDGQIDESIMDSKKKTARAYAKGEIAVYLSTPFHRAVQKRKDLRHFIQLMDQGFDIDEKNQDGHTALHRAVLDHNEHYVQLLFGNCYADKTIEDGNGETPLQLALRLSNQENRDEEKETFEKIIKLFQQSSDPSPLHIALLKNASNETIESLMSKPNLQSKDSLGNSPWHIAVMRGNTDALNLLYKHSKNTVQQKNAAGDTPAHFAFFILDLIPNDKKGSVQNFFNSHEDLKPEWTNLGSFKKTIQKQQATKKARVQSGNLKEQIDQLSEDIARLKNLKPKTSEVSKQITIKAIEREKLVVEVDNIMQTHLLYGYDQEYFIYSSAEKLSFLALTYLGFSLPEMSFPSLSSISGTAQRPFNALHNFYLETSFPEIQLPSLPTDITSVVELAQKPFYYLYDVYQNIPASQIIESLSPSPVQKVLISVAALHVVSSAINTLVRAHFTINAFQRRILSDAISAGLVISGAMYFGSVSPEQMSLYIAGTYAAELAITKIILPVGRVAAYHLAELGNWVQEKISGTEEPTPELKLTRIEKTE